MKRKFLFTLIFLLGVFFSIRVHASDVLSADAVIYVSGNRVDYADFTFLPDADVLGEYALAVRPIAAAAGLQASGGRNFMILRNDAGAVIQLQVNRTYAIRICPDEGRQTLALTDNAPILYNGELYINATALAELLGFVLIESVNAYMKPVFHFIPINEAAEARYRHNRGIFEEILTQEGSGFIYGQNREPVRNLQIGALGTGGGHGCGPIAVYNALLYLYRYHQPEHTIPNPASIIRYLDYRHGMNLGGLAGTNPEVLTNYLRRAGHQAEITYAPTEIDAYIKEATVAILLYGRVRGGFFVHYVMVRYESGRFHVYNEFGNDTAPRVYNSIDRLVQTRGYRTVALIVI